MWAATTTLSYRLLCPPPTTTGTGPLTVSAKYRKNINYDYEDDEIENDQELQKLKQQQIDNDREYELMKRQEIGDLDVNVSASNNSEKISGSVVLLALQKASAKKITSKKMKKNKGKNVKEEEDDDDDKRNKSDVKELCIKSDWKDRLDELETQLNQLIHNI